jgi:membrane-associated protease RseP (regulator of RpoE activity)
VQFLGILAFVVALLISVMIHEFGHFITAKHYGMRVSEFFLGFGTKIWSTVRGETEFGIKAIPAGGYCRIEGMTPSESGEGDERDFYRASGPRKLVVLGAGSFLHFVLGFLLLLILFMAIGTSQVTSTIGEVSKCTAAVTSGQACTPTSPQTPAQSAGLRVGDRIVSIDGKRITNWSKDVEIIRNSPGKALVFGIDRGQKVAGSNSSKSDFEITITPASRISNGKSIGYIGVINTYATVRSDPVRAVKESVTTTGSLISGSVKALISLPGKIPALWSQTVGDKPRDAQGLVGVVGVARLSGEAVGSKKLTVSERFAAFIVIIAQLNIFVGIFNLLPILPLDGGHMAVAIADEVRAFLARLRGRKRPAAIDVAVLTPITMVVFFLLAGLTLLLLVADVVNPVNFNL